MSSLRYSLLPSRGHLVNNTPVMSSWKVILCCQVRHLGNSALVQVIMNIYCLPPSHVHLGNNTRMHVTRNYSLLPSGVHSGNSDQVYVIMKSYFCCHLVGISRISPNCMSSWKVILCCYLVCSSKITSEKEKKHPSVCHEKLFSAEILLGFWGITPECMSEKVILCFCLLCVLGRYLCVHHHEQLFSAAISCKFWV